MKKVYIVSHSHWDREWYIPYEAHHMRLIELMDDLLELFETDPEFDSFHLDGQTIILDDYLQVRPEKEAAVRRAIEAGKLKIGPFYILQDAFLTSSESNVRNMLIGMQESKKWGTPVKLGYFPDTFGNMGQTPQLMKEANLDVAAFGRGVKPTGFNNVVINDEKYSSQFSEMWWDGPDGSRILGVLFANWYSNGNEIPTNKEQAKVFWEQKLRDAEQYAATDHLLMMNGCDHQPVQKDITEAIRVANELYPDIEFIHAGFDTYLNALKADLPADLSVIEGELTSQESDGWYTLANTASSRVYLKQRNTEVSCQLENMAEPLATMAFAEGFDYPSDQLDYAWKTLMQNHPHDSICGCSVDAVHRGMMTRFETANEVGKYVASEATAFLANKIDTSAFRSEAKPFVVWNTTSHAKTGSVQVEIEWERMLFAGNKHDTLYDKLSAKPVPEVCVIDVNGNQIPFEIITHEVKFGFDLPKDAFRVPYIARYITVQLFLTEMPAYSHEVFALVQKEANTLGENIIRDGRTLENEFIRVDIQENGQLTATHKATSQVHENLLSFEETGDIGNEYIFFEPTGVSRYYSHDVPANIQVIRNTPNVGEIEIRQEMLVPESADELLEKEQKMVLEFKLRQAKRSKKMKKMMITTRVVLEKNNSLVQFETTVNNDIKDHRLRVLFPTSFETNVHQADSIYEVVSRQNKMPETWENVTNPNHQHAFVHMGDESFGMTIANFGLNEYEVLEDNTIALTLFRSVGEMGDWGYFETPEAQCLGEQVFKYALILHGADGKEETFHQAKQFQVPFTAAQTGIHTGSLPAKSSFLTADNDAFLMTALKKAQDDDAIIVRGYNLKNTKEPLQVKMGGRTSYRSNLLEEGREPLLDELKPAEIMTIKFVK
ncbi:alpha-mannosidase [Listeria fleischmannii]|uniref:Alpha-mannosidase n=1 Tax=Listeria fleischmannii FSL S10-1203 TaxID=1265822 RepID=W7DV68_9LIST|nr:alpha-mannosidase [Listeria fleischmannii]EUJ51701.1 alpha-mannosidase [Listeria fleischmannii FSL S10-1203]